ncbi:MAG: DEAD/DEAH box helicase family protein [Saccharofermentanales bacterium]|jgi:type III restriction enzyme
MNDRYLYEEVEVIEKAGYLGELPEYIPVNLSESIELRDYQELAFRYFISYAENDNLRKNKQLHTLFHMATGSGKTVIMAGLIFYLYAQGYRNFLFFVNQTNILEKTKENFLNPASGKFLFAESPAMYGDHIPISEVENFAHSNPEGINLCFTTTQQLHLDLNFSKENSLTIEDFEDNKVVLISDESHHINTRTKKLSKTEEAQENSWEYSVERIFRANRDNVLLEFTATADLKDPNVRRKYLDKIIFDYPLAKFRASGYTKDFQNLQSDTNLWQRTLIALVLSEYRLNLFADCGQNVKPVILLKSQRIDDSKAFYNAFFRKLETLRAEEIEALQNVGDELFQTALDYFREKDKSLQSLVISLRQSFAEENAIIMNGTTDNTKEKQLAVNSLEEHNNPYRIIFTVDMLNEGWDVLNLFDIVRLYETRQSKSGGKIGSYTIKEAQLIGRGARYCPFVAEEDQERFKRKYDYDLTNQNRILETMLYHSKQDSRYITELRQALKATGLLPDNPLEVEYRLKDEFRNSDFFRYGLVFSNRKQVKHRREVKQIEERIKHSSFSFSFDQRRAWRYGLFEDTASAQMRSLEQTSRLYRTSFQLKELPLNILFGAADSFEGLKFNVLKSHYPNLKSLQEFLTSDNYIGKIRLDIESDHEDLSASELFTAAKQVLDEVSRYILSIKQEYEGSREFYDKPVRDVLRDKKIYLAEKEGDYGLGYAQSELQGPLAINLKQEDWYVYNDNYSTSEEKAFVKYFSHLIDEIKKQYEEIYLVRNERIADLAIYSFDTGERFEPDYLLFLRKKHADGYEQEQIYIEPKGSHLLEKDAWKEALLLRIEEEGIPCKKYADDNQYRVIGLPFFNEEYRLAELEKAMESFITTL